ncbi:ABC transporter permease [Paenibacillus urinalis]|uniref:ABC transporter permease n=1 Tax=Paenibacillus urinalis TaxID=521520 RepID=A0AAX3N7S4_9BACL|nr:oligopeptide ABC transporter permease [Paenibacillus urinalis]WDH84810.1 ABC transporter permease [Paenibacillus urinalis]WDH96269.1 ABC transporter permease [Paenibacillus urinalis]WDI04492.1 ABC transporter permease [Paenibacillus urinalis]
MPSLNVQPIAASEDRTSAAAASQVPSYEADSYWIMIRQRFMSHKLAVAGLIMMGFLILVGIFAPLIAPYDPNAIIGAFSASPSGAHWLGTDQVGRDVLSRLIYATRVSLAVGVITVILYVLIGTVVGAIAGYVGGWVDMLINRIIDVFMSFPSMMVILVLVTVLGTGLSNIIIVLALLGWPAVARLVRGSVLSLRQTEFVRAGIALGFSSPRLIFGHILPNAMGPILVNATFGAAAAILSESSLSFLGMGVQPPAASWGNMLNAAQSITALTTQPWLWIPPGLVIILSVLSINFIGDGIRDAMDPRRTGA